MSSAAASTSRDMSRNEDKIAENAESLLKRLSHYSTLDNNRKPLSRVPDARKVAWQNIPAGDCGGGIKDDFECGDPLALASAQLPHAVDSDMDSGGDSDTDTLKSAGVWTDVETVKTHLAHLNKLKGAYLAEFDHLRNSMKESRRRYLKDVAVEKQSYCSIHAQPKDSVEERAAYARLKALRRYHKHNGRQALARHALLEKRNAASIDGAPARDRKSSKHCCTYNQGSWKCGEQSVPLAKLCVKHILEDPRQVLYRACGVSGSEPCTTAIIPQPHITTCIYHTPLPLQKKSSSSTTEEENDKKEQDGGAGSSKVTPSLLLSGSTSVTAMPQKDDTSNNT